VALNTRELYLVLRARDEASRSIRAFGGQVGRLGTLTQRLNAAQTRSAARNAEARNAIAESEIKMRDLQIAKQTEMVAITVASNNQMAVSDEKREAIARGNLKMQQLRAAKVAEIADLQRAINVELEKSEIERSQTVINAARREIAAIKLRTDSEIRAVQAQVLANREALLESNETLSAMARSTAAYKLKADAAISSAAREVEANRVAAASARELGAAETLAAREAIHGYNARQQVAQRRMAVGSSVMTAGVVTAAVGAVGIAALNETTKAYAAYQEQVAKTETQTQGLNISMKTLSKIGLDTGRNLAIDFDQVQPALYDIFSSIDVNAPQAAKLLRTIGQASVGGKVDMETSGRAIMGVLNAYKMNVGQATHVSDVLFQLVAKGVGTYQQFGTTIGRAIPSAVKANQTFEQTAAMMAFLTRNGLSAAMASASTGRALDAIANPKSIAAFKDLGSEAQGAFKALGETKGVNGATINFKKMSLSVLDAKGNIRPMVDIIHDLNNQLKGMTKEQKAATLQDVFKGSGGTIQAMRFFNHALNDSNDLLGEMTTDMNNANGAAASAYKTMANTPEAQFKLFKNRVHALSIEIGGDLIPIKLRLLTILARMVGWFNNLGAGTKKVIAYVLAFAAAGLVLLGLLLTLVGIFIVFAAGLELIGANFAAIAVGIGVFALLGAAIAVAVKYHNQLASSAKYLSSEFQKFLPIIEDAWKRVEPTLVKGAQNVEDAIGGFIKYLGNHKKDFNNFFTSARNVVKTAMDFIVLAVKIAWPIITNTIGAAIAVAGPIIVGFMKVFSVLAGVFNGLPDSARNVVLAIGLIAFAFRNTAFISGFTTRIATGMSGLATTVRGSVGGINGVLGAIGAGAVIGTIAGHMDGIKGKIVGALGSAAAGAAIGFSVGGPLGAAILGTIGGVTGLITAWHGQGSAAAASAKAAREAMQEEVTMAATLKQALQETNGAYNDQYKAAIISQLQSKRAFEYGKQLNYTPKQITDAATNGGGAIQTQLTGNLNKAQTALQPLLAQQALGQIPLNASQIASVKAIQSQITAIKGLATALGIVIPATADAEQGLEDANAAMGKTTVSAKLLAGGFKNIKQEVAGYGTSLTTSSNKTAAASAFALRNTKVLKENADQVGKNAALQLKHGVSADKVVAGYESQIGALSKAAVAAGFNKAAVDKLLASYTSLPKSVVTALKANTKPGILSINAMQNYINAIKQGHIPGITANTAAGRLLIQQLEAQIQGLRDKELTITVDANITAQANRAAALLDKVGGGSGTIKFGGGIGIAGKAEGGKVTGPGTETSDSIPALLSNNEFVVRARQAKKYSRLLNAINNGTFSMRDIPKYAKGGKVTAKATASIPGVQTINTSSSHTSTKGKVTVTHGTDFKFLGHVYDTLNAVQNHINSAKTSLKNTGFAAYIAAILTDVKTLDKANAKLNVALQNANASKALQKSMSNREKVMRRDLVQLNSYKTQLATATDNINNLKSEKTDLAGTVKSAVTGSFDQGSELGSFSDISGDLNSSVADAKAFVADINKLKELGYSPAVISDLYAKGPAALPTIESLLTATKPQAQAYSKQFDTLASLGTQAGNSVASNMYDAGINAAQGLINGLNSKIGALTKTMNGLAAGMVAAIKKGLGIKSPSVKFHFLGLMSMKGMANGLDAGMDYVNKSLDASTNRMLDYMATTEGMNRSYMNGSVGKLNIQSAPAPAGNVDNSRKVVFEAGAVVTQEIDPTKHAADLGWETMRRVG
jgi:TP901 family phage tail tape measure protein